MHIDSYKYVVATEQISTDNLQLNTKTTLFLCS